MFIRFDNFIMEDDVLGSKFYVGVNAIKGLERIVNLLVREHFRLGVLLSLEDVVNSLFSIQTSFPY